MLFGDLFSLYSTVQNAVDEKQKANAQAALTEEVEGRIRKLLTPSDKYQKGQRSFDAIRFKLAIFDDNPKELKQYLIGMGAERLKGDDGKEYWVLAESSKQKTNPLVDLLKSPTFIFVVIILLISAAVSYNWEIACEFDFLKTLCNYWSNLPAEKLEALDNLTQELIKVNNND